MKLRTRVLGWTVLLVLIPLLVLALLIRREMAGRLTDQYERRVDALIEVIETDLRETGEDLEQRSAILKNTFADDNRIRRHLLDGQEALRPYVLDWATRTMTLAGLDLLQVQDAAGRIVSSGHFRNEYDRVDREIVSGLIALGRPALVRARRPEAPFLALACVDSLRLGSDRYTLVTGVEIDRGLLARLSPGGDPVVSLIHSGGALSPDPALETELAVKGVPRSGEMLVRAIRLPVVASGHAGETARLLATHSLAPRRELLRSLDRWLLVAGLLAAAGSVWLASRLSARISRPMEELARKTDALDLDRLDADFSSDRTDEIGTLSRFLGRMTGRLRASVVRLKEAERRATIGELARQVNHDLRNAFHADPQRRPSPVGGRARRRRQNLATRVPRAPRARCEAGLSLPRETGGRTTPEDLPASGAGHGSCDRGQRSSGRWLRGRARGGRRQRRASATCRARPAARVSRRSRGRRASHRREPGDQRPREPAARVTRASWTIDAGARRARSSPERTGRADPWSETTASGSSRRASSESSTTSTRPSPRREAASVSRSSVRLGW